MERTARARRGGLRAPFDRHAQVLPVAERRAEFVFVRTGQDEKLASAVSSAVQDDVLDEGPPADEQQGLGRVSRKLAQADGPAAGEDDRLPG